MTRHRLVFKAACKPGPRRREHSGGDFTRTLAAAEH
jgi:hypothetical protein